MTPIEKLPVEAQIRRIFGKDATMALAISQAENGTRKCDRIGVTGDIGVFQIAPQYHYNKVDNIEQLKDCLTNIRVAKRIYDASGWHAWAVFNNELYKKFLN